MTGKNIIEPLVTEKSMGLTTSNKYTFKVLHCANKHEIAKEVKSIYNVNPIDIKIVNIKGKKIVYRGRFKGQRKDYKKAIVKLDKKEKIKEFIIKE